jgi:hypothetical protein
MKNKKDIIKQNKGWYGIDYDKLALLTVDELEEFIVKRLRDGLETYYPLNERGRAGEERETVFTIILSHYRENKFIKKFLKAIDNIVKNIFLKYDWKNVTEKEIDFFIKFSGVCINTCSYGEDVIKNNNGVLKTWRDISKRWMCFVKQDSSLMGIKNKHGNDLYGYALSTYIYLDGGKEFWIPFIEADENKQMLFNGRHVEKGYRALAKIDFDYALNYLGTLFEWYKAHPDMGDMGFVVFCIMEELIEKRKNTRDQVRELIGRFLKDDYHNLFCEKMDGFIEVVNP